MNTLETDLWETPMLESYTAWQHEQFLKTAYATR